MNSLSCITFLLVISTVFSDPLLDLNVGAKIGLDLGGGGGGCGGCRDKVKKQNEEPIVTDKVQKQDEKPKVTDEVQKQDEEPQVIDEVQKQDEEPQVIEIQTSDKLEYRFFPVSNGEVRFTIRAPTDAHLAFTTTPVDADPIYEIIVSGFGNSRSVIRKNRSKSNKADEQTDQFLSGNEFRGFWVKWDFDSGSISCGRENEDAPFISWVDPEPIEINYIGVSTGYGAEGTWRLQGPEVDKDGNPVSTST